jgi:tetratricopeptide (TPR) repeat protein
MRDISATPAAFRTALAAGLLLAMTVVAYLPALDAGFIWDDDLYVTANTTLRNVDGLRRIWLQEPGTVPQYYPLTYTTFWAEYQLWGLRPFGYHAVNVVLHALNAILLWRVLRRLCVPAAWAAAAVFALHPMNVESVAWITERKNVLSGLCYLSALLMYLRMLPGAQATRRFPWRAYAALCILFATALLSKSVTCTLPAVLLLLTWWRQGAIDRRTVSILAPLLLAGLGFALATIWMERTHVGAQGEEWAFSVVERLLIAGRAFWFYPRTLLWPYPLAFIYPRWSIDRHVWWQYGFPAAALAAVAALYVLRRRIGNGPLVAALCYGGTLLPALGFFNVYPMRYSFVADHFAYLAIIPLIALVTAAANALVTRATANRMIGEAMTGSLLLVLGLLTARQCGIYRDLRTLWTDTVAKNPDSWLAHNNLGIVLADEGDLDAAAAHYTRALQLRPAYPETYINLGNVMQARGHFDAAMANYRAALRLRPDYPEASNDLGAALAASGQLDDAIAQYTRALELKPDYPEAHYNLGNALRTRGRTAEAVAHYTEALRWRPAYPEAHHGLGLALAAQGQTAEAAVQYGEAVRLRPAFAEARNNLGILLAAQGKTDDAVAQYVQALQTKPDYAEGHYNLATVLLAAHRIEEAKAHFTAALRIRPDYAEAHNNLGFLLFEQGRRDEAVAEYRAALHLKPDYPDAHTNLGTALAAGGNTAEAVAHFETALRLNPDHTAARQQLERVLAETGGS